MAQYGRPMEDTFNGGWVRQNGDSIGIFQSIDDAVQDDADYVQSGLNPPGQVFVTKLTAMVDPGIDTGHFFRIAGKKNLTGGRIIDVLVQLRQNYVNEATPGTLIAENLFLDVQQAVGGAFGVYQAEINPLSIANITDYTDLFVRIVATVRP